MSTNTKFIWDAGLLGLNRYKEGRAKNSAMQNPFDLLECKRTRHAAGIKFVCQVFSDNIRMDKRGGMVFKNNRIYKGWHMT